MSLIAGVRTTEPHIVQFSKQYYSNKALDVREKKFHFAKAAAKETMPKNQGRMAVFYRWQNFQASATVSVPEGVPGSGLVPKSRALTLRLAQFANNITLSDLSLDTGPDSMVENIASRFGYFAGLGNDTLTRGFVDAASTDTASMFTLTNPNNLPTLKDLRAIRTVLATDDVEPLEGNDMTTIMCPYGSYDFLNDPDNTSVLELTKYTMPDKGGLTSYEDRGTIVRIAGHHVIESTNVYTNGAGLYRGYSFGKESFGIVELSGRGPSKVTDPKKQKFKLHIETSGKPTSTDPEGKIGGFMSYNYLFGGGIWEGPTAIGGVYRLRMFDHATSLT